MAMVKIIGWALIIISFFIVEISLINMWVKSQNKHLTFPCTYIQGTCTKKPSYDNCKQFGQVPISVCETRLNYGDFTIPED